MNVETLILAKEDKPIVLTLKDALGQPLVFANLVDVEIKLTVNKTLVETYTKTGGTVLAIAGETAKCKFLITVAQQADWPTGLLEAQITTAVTDGDFPPGRRTAQTANLYYCKKGV